MSTTALRSNQIVDVALTKIAQGYKAPKLVFDQVAPKIVTPAASGKYISWGKEAFKLYNTRRALGAVATSVDFSFATKAFAFPDGYSLDAAIDDRQQRRLSQSTNINAAAQKAKPLMHTIALQKEIAVANIVKNPASYVNSGAVSAIWSGGSANIKKDIDDAKGVVLDSIGLEPNIMVVSRDVYNVLKLDPKVQDMYKHTTPGFPTAKILAEAFEVDEIIVGVSTYTNAGASTKVWGTGLCALLYRGQGSDSYPVDPYDMEPSFMFMLQEEGMPRSIRYRDESRRSEMVGIDDNFLALQTSDEAGYLFTGVLA